MKILQVYHGPYQIDTGGGISVYVRNISERLAKKHDVTVFATNPGNLPRFEVVNGVKIERFRRFAPGRAYFFSWEMLSKLRKTYFDVVHGHGYQAFPMHFSALSKRKKFVASTHFHGVGHSAFRNILIKLSKPFGRATLETANKIIAVSEHEKSIICNQFGLDTDEIVVIPCGVNFGEFERQKKKQEFRSILYVGRLVAYKGVRLLVDILPMLDDDIVLDIVGQGPLRLALENHAKELNVSDRVRFSRNLPRSKLVQKFMDASVFVLPSKYEAYSLVVAEALVAGLPCVLADTSALSEWIDNRVCFGVGVPVDLNELSKAVSLTLESEFDKGAMTKWFGTKIVDWNEVVDLIENVYEE